MRELKGSLFCMSKMKGEDEVIVSGIIKGLEATIKFLKKFVKNKE